MHHVDSSLVARLPKVDLHCHIGGTLRAATVATFASKYAIPLPRPCETLYEYRDFYDFIDVLRLIAKVILHPDDLARIAYEAIADAHQQGNARHLEMSFNPQYFLGSGLSYPNQVDGLVAGIRAAESDFPVSALLIASFDRDLDLRSAAETMDAIVSYRHERVVGIGLDGPERSATPAQFAAIFQQATRAGLRKTAHVCEDNQTLAEAPASNVADCLALLGCDRLDHGYNLMSDPTAVRRARDAGTAFCVCGVTCVAQRQPARLEVVKQMHEAGLAITINTDDPAMYHTDLNHCYDTVLDGCGWGWKEATQFSLAGVDASWLDDVDKRRLRSEFERQIALLDGEQLAGACA